MANWQRTLDLVPEWGKAQAEQITPSQLAKVVAERLAALEPFTTFDHIEEGRLELISQFQMLGDDLDCDFTDFNEVFEDLYDWGDTALTPGLGGKKVCWIKTF